MVEVLFVCTGNICRSPTAEGVFRRLVREAGLAGRIGVDSAGTEAYHVGEPPDPRACAAARARGYPIDDLRARQLSAADFQRFDLMLALDGGHLRALNQQLNRQAARRPGLHLPPAHLPGVHLFLDFAPGLGVREVPDPYYGDPGGFVRVLELIEAGARGLLAAIVSGDPPP
jgi:protein-tyrosine phosphatase